MNIVKRLLVWIGRGAQPSPQDDFTSNIDFSQLERALQYRIRDRKFFFEALSHRSFLQFSGSSNLISNERLEFLGDAVLSTVVAEYLFRSHPDADEGELTKIRSRLVNRKALSVYGNEMQLGSFLLMSPGASQVAGKGMETIIADAFEAIIGAIYLDGGYRRAMSFIEGHIRRALDQGVVKIEDENFKSQLLEYAQAEGLGTPRYITVHQEGPDHDRTFTIEVHIGNEFFGKGVGKNKKDAEQAAAEQGLQTLMLHSKP